MHLELLDILRCPFCGGRLGLVETGFLNRRGDDVLDGTLGCHCCAYPIVDGIPVLHLQAPAAAARDHLEAGRADLARRTMLGIEDRADGGWIDDLTGSPAVTYREIVEALGAGFEGDYFLYRFTDPTYLTACAVTRAVASTVVGPGGRAVDLCGGSGHLTRALVGASAAPPVLTDLYYAKLWLGRRFVAPGCEAICCDGNAPLPFASRAFRLAVCSDAYHYVWTKRLFADEMVRIAGADRGGAAVIAHAHNARVWNPSAGMPLPPEGYRALFCDVPARLYGDPALLADVADGRPLDLSRTESDGALDAAPSISLVASSDPRVFATYPVDEPGDAAGEFRVNPLYTAHREGDVVHLSLQFPSRDYEEEYGAATRQYLPERVSVEAAALAGLPARRLPGPLRALARQRVVVDLPKGYGEWGPPVSR